LPYPHQCLSQATNSANFSRVVQRGLCEHGQGECHALCSAVAGLAVWRAGQTGEVGMKTGGLLLGLGWLCYALFSLMPDGSTTVLSFPWVSIWQAG